MAVVDTSIAEPEFVDNYEVTLADALNGHLDWLESVYRSPAEMSIASGYFNAEGFAIVADRLERLSRVRLLPGAEPIPPPARPVRKRGIRKDNYSSEGQAGHHS